MDLSLLNPQQIQAVTAGGGQTLVLAGPGSGKTRVLTHRIAYLIREMDLRPYNLLAVTFTNKAAREMENRVNTMIGEKLEGMWLGTFHAMCARLLRREADLMPFNSSFVIMDADDQETLVKRCLQDLKISDKQYKPGPIHAAISSAKNEMIGPADYPTANYRDELTKRVYEHYQGLLQTNNAVDFDDLLVYAVRLLQDNPDVRERYGRRFHHVLVDEFQDTNQAQYELIRHLSSYYGNLFVVGDEDQSIYRWRGADYRNVLRFEKDYPQCKKILLEQNYRSTQNVLDAARAVIDHNVKRTPKHLFSERGAGDLINLYEAVDDHAEAAYVVDTIQQLISGRKAKPGDFAVMYRTNAQSRLLEESFLRVGMPYRLVGAQRFYGRREVKDVIALLRLAQNPDDEISLGRMINVPPRGIGDKSWLALQLAAQQGRTTAGQVLISMGTLGEDSPYWGAFRGRGASLLADFGSRFSEWHSLVDIVALPTLFDRVLEETGYHEYLEDGSEEGKDRWDNVQELRRLAFEYQERGLSAFLENLALVSDQDTLPEVTEAPTLLTLHAAKGLEFSRVFIIGLDEGLLPHSRSRDDPEEMAEERRLFYVGLTRAKNCLYLARSERRSTYGSFEDSIPSRFLDDIPKGLLQRQGYRRPSRTGSRQYNPADYTWASNTQRGNPPPPASAPVTQRYKAGNRVTHPVWGEGLVIESRILDGDETLDVVFESVGFKRLVASLANLQIIK